VRYAEEGRNPMATEVVLALVVGAVMGFIGSMPIAGPVAVLVLERGLVRRAREGMAIAGGAAAGETIYAFVACWGVGAFFSAYPRVLPVSRLLGACVLVGLGIYLATRRRTPAAPAPDGEPSRGRKRRGFVLGASLALLNPTIIASWTVVVATAHGAGLLRPGVLPAVGFAVGVGLGIVSWFATLLRLIHRFERGLRPETIDRVLHVTGWLVVALGVGLAVRPLAQALGVVHS
jgi:threonine/homoserine/homoserine lactone efflux protein